MKTLLRTLFAAVLMTGGCLAASVLDNDVDPDGDPMTAVLDTAPAHGALTLNEDGSFTYKPVENYSGADTFTYHAVDANGTPSNVVTVTITVTPANDPPVAEPDAYTVDEDGELTSQAAPIGWDMGFGVYLAVAPADEFQRHMQGAWNAFGDGRNEHDVWLAVWEAENI